MKRTRQFTLIELLLVIGIMILIMGLTVPSFRRMASGNAVNASARMLAGQLNLARAAAIAEQRYIAIIMPGCDFKKPTPAGEASGNSSDEYHFRSFRVGIVEPTSTANQFQLVEWYPGANWSFLPVGAVIAEVNDSAVADTRTSGVELYKYGDKRIINTNENNDDSDNWLTDNELKDSNGTKCTVIDGSYATLAEGKENNSHSNAYARAVVFSPKGRCCTGQGLTGDRFITIVEGNIDGTEQTSGKISNAVLSRGKIYNMRILKIGQYTGRVEYVNLEAED